jgi:aspartate-semialdehyde dehydrogenase
MVGQQLIALLYDHLWFEVTVLADLGRFAGKRYSGSVEGRWALDVPVPESIADMTVWRAEDDIDTIVSNVDVIFSVLRGDMHMIRALEERYAEVGVPVISDNPAERWVKDVPIIIPEINASHTDIIPIQKNNRGWDSGFIVSVPSHSVQSYVPALYTLRSFSPERVILSTLDPVSSAGETLGSWESMRDNIIPFVPGEEGRSEKEPLKILGILRDDAFIDAKDLSISATCVRVPLSSGHMAMISVSFKQKATREAIIHAWRTGTVSGELSGLPSSVSNLVFYTSEDDRPQPRYDRPSSGGMGVTVGRLRKDPILDWKFICFSHNMIRGAAGGAVLIAELLVKRGYIQNK